MVVTVSPGRGINLTRLPSLFQAVGARDPQANNKMLPLGSYRNNHLTSWSNPDLINYSWPNSSGPHRQKVSAGSWPVKQPAAACWAP